MGNPNADDFLFPDAAKPAPVPTPAVKASAKPKTSDDFLFAPEPSASETKPVAAVAPKAVAPKAVPVAKPPVQAAPKAAAEKAAVPVPVVVPAPIAKKAPAPPVLEPVVEEEKPLNILEQTSPTAKLFAELPKPKPTTEAAVRYAVAKAAKAAAEKGQPTGTFATEKELLKSGVEEVAKPLLHLAQQGGRLTDVLASEAEAFWAKKLYEATPADIAFGVPKEFAMSLRESTRKSADEALAEFQAATRKEKSRVEEEQRKKAEAAPPPLVDEAESRRLADAILAKTAGTGDNPAKTYYERRKSQLLVGWDAAQETDAAKYEQMQQLASQKALAELSDLYTRGGLRQFNPTTVLAGPLQRTNLSEEILKSRYLPTSSKAILAAAAAPLDTDIGLALRPQRKVLPSGQVARGESSVGYLLNAALGAPDFVLSTGLDALLKEEAPKYDDLVKNTDARRDPITWYIENNERVQAGITSDDPLDNTRALVELLPVIGLTLASPDIVTAAKTVANIPGIAKDAAKAAELSRDVVKAVQAAPKGERITTFERAVENVQKQVAAAKETEKAAKDLARRARIVKEAGDAVERTMQRADGDVQEAIRLLRANAENAIAFRLQDDIAARLSADPDIKEFIFRTGMQDQPNLKEHADLPLLGAMDDTVRESAERGRAKYAAALEDAGKAAVADFMQQAAGAAVPEVRRGNILPKPEDVTDDELKAAFGEPGTEYPGFARKPLPPAEPPEPPAPPTVLAEIPPRLIENVGKATNVKELVAAIRKLPADVRDAVARRFGATSFEDLQKTANVDLAASAEKAKKIEEDLAEKRAALTKKADRVAALKAEPEMAKADLAARDAFTAAKKEATDADKLAANAAAGKLPEHDDLKKKAQAAEKAGAAVDKAAKDAKAAADKAVKEAAAEADKAVKEATAAAAKADRDLQAANNRVAAVEKKEPPLSKKPTEKERAAFDKWLDAADPIRLAAEQAEEAKVAADKALKQAQANADKVRKQAQAIADKAAKATQAEAAKALKVAQAELDAASKAATKAVADAYAKQKKARDKLAVALDAHTKRTRPGRAVGKLTPAGQRAFQYVGEPIFVRGYVNRPPMKYVAGKRAHLLNRALEVEAAAARKYLSGDATVDFAAQLGKTEHVGEAPPHTPSATSRTFAEYRVRGPDGKVSPYKLSDKDTSGLPTQRDYEPIITWQKAGEDLWSWAERVAKKHPNQPRAKTLNEYFRSLTAYADPARKPDEVDMIRLDDTVYVTDAEAAKKVGQIPQAIEPYMSAEGLPVRVEPAVSDGFAARVVGFRIAKDGTAIPVVRPLELVGATLNDTGRPTLEVDPSTFTFMERGRHTGEEAGDAVTRPYTDNDWALLNKREDATPGARTLRYADKDRFPKLSPPERPAKDSFNYNPDHPSLQRYFTDAERAAIKAEMAEDVPTLPRVTVGKGKAYEDTLASAEADVAQTEKAIQELEAKLDAERLTPGQVTTLTNALESVKPEYQDIAARLSAQAEYAKVDPEKLVLPARKGSEDLLRDIEQRSRMLEASELSSRFGIVLSRLRDLGRPRIEVEEQSLLPMARDLKRSFEGQMRRVGAELSRAVRTVNPKSTAINTGAEAVFTDWQEAFRAALLSGTAQEETVSSALRAYLKDPTKMTAADQRLAAQQMIEWARSGEGFASLREKMIGAARRTNTDVRALQEGDVLLAYAVSTEGIWRQTVSDAKAKGVALPKDLAEAANSTVTKVFGVESPGGRADASLGFAVLADIMVPEDYRAPIAKLRDLTEAPLAEPMVPAIQRGGIQAMPKPPKDAAERAAVVEQIRELLEQTDELMSEPVYVPRAMRDALTRQLDALMATLAIEDKPFSLPYAAGFWKQAVVLGTASSKPNQVWNDYYGNLAGALTAGVGMKNVAKVAARSFIAQLLATNVTPVPGASSVGQILALADSIRALRTGKDIPRGSTARDALALLTFTPEIHAISIRDPNFKIGDFTADELHNIWSQAGVFEGFASEQLSRSVDMLIQRSAGLGGQIQHLLNVNRNTLQDIVNIAATRQRVALAYTLMEAGLDPVAAGKKAVEIVGDFAGELHPIESGIISMLFPFYSYRKFNARRTMKALMSPYWLTRLDKGEEIGAQVASWYLDDSDEFGYHTDSMEEEYDPEEMGKIRAEVLQKHKEWSASSKEAEMEARRRAQALAIPKARVRYDRMVARLREIARTQGRKAALAASITDPDAQQLKMYYSPDPVQMMLEGQNILPEYHLDRHPVWLSENRNQALNSWHEANVGKFKKPGDEQAYRLFPSNPNTSGIAELMAFGGLGAALVSGGTALAQGAMSAAEQAVLPDDARLMEQRARGTRPDANIGIADGFFRDPTVQLLLSASNQADMQQQSARVIPNDAVGEVLFKAELAERSVEFEQGANVLEVRESMTGPKYTMPADAVNAAYVVPVAGQFVIGALDAADLWTGLVEGKPRRPTPSTTREAAGARFDVMTGQRTFAVSPALQEYYTRTEAEENVQKLAEGMPAPKESFVNESVFILRGMSAQEKSATAQEEQTMAVLNVLARREIRPIDYPALRVYLRRNGYTDTQIVAMNNLDIEREVRKVAAASLTK